MPRRAKLFKSANLTSVRDKEFFTTETRRFLKGLSKKNKSEMKMRLFFYFYLIFSVSLWCISFNQN